jgi:hypothetical protein
MSAGLAQTGGSTNSGTPSAAEKQKVDREQISVAEACMDDVLGVDSHSEHPET